MAEEMYEATRNEQVSVTTSSSVISNARSPNTPRKKILIRNTSPNATDIITLNIGNNTATANQGVVLYQYEFWSDSSEIGNEAHQGVISAICATATGKLSIFER